MVPQLSRLEAIPRGKVVSSWQWLSAKLNSPHRSICSLEKDSIMGSAPVQTMQTPKQRRQCWECLRRRLVCDMTQPACKKCQKAKIDCPGYGAKKPLTWVAPCAVLSRPRRKRILGAEDQELSSSEVSTSPDSAEGSLAFFQQQPLTTELDEVFQAFQYCVFVLF